MLIYTRSGLITYENQMVSLGEKLKDSNGKVFINSKGQYYNGFHIESFVRTDFSVNQNSSYYNTNYYIANIILNADIKNVLVKFDNENQALFVYQLFTELQNNKIRSFHNVDYKIGLISSITINQLAVIYKTKQFMKSDIVSAAIISDTNTSLLDKFGHALLGGGLGMVSSKLNPNVKYSINLNTKRDGIISIPCDNLSIASSVFAALGCERFIKKSLKSGDISKSTLKDKLNEIEKLKNEGIISEEEYKLKRKQIIEKY